MANPANPNSDSQQGQTTPASDSDATLTAYMIYQATRVAVRFITFWVLASLAAVGAMAGLFLGDSQNKEFLVFLPTGISILLYLWPIIDAWHILDRMRARLGSKQAKRATPTAAQNIDQWLASRPPSDH